MPEYGNIAYTAYRNILGWRQADDSIVPLYNELNEKEHRAWDAVVDAILDAYDEAMKQEAAMKAKALAQKKDKL